MAFQNIKIKDDIVTYQEEVTDDIQKIHEIRKKMNFFNVGSPEWDELKKQEKIEESKTRIIHYSFPLTRLKTYCCDCGNNLVKNQDELTKERITELLIQGYIVRGNYCSACNTKYT